jgi:hypothetical protein
MRGLHKSQRHNSRGSVVTPRREATTKWTMHGLMQAVLDNAAIVKGETVLLGID